MKLFPALSNNKAHSALYDTIKNTHNIEILKYT